MTAFTATLKHTALATLALLGGVGSANAGIIVTIGRPSPELLRKVLMNPYGHQNTHPGAGTSYCRDQIFCVELPIINKQICTETVALDDEADVPADWSCLELADSIYYCEDEDEVGGFLHEDTLSELVVQPALDAQDEAEEQDVKSPPFFSDSISTTDQADPALPAQIGSGAGNGGAISYEGEVAQACQGGGLGYWGILAGLGLLAWRRRR